jgi:hypothetical protein
MNRYAVTLYSNVDGASVCISFPVNTPMTKQQLKVYYQSQSVSISKVEVFG